MFFIWILSIHWRSILIAIIDIGCYLEELFLNYLFTYLLVLIILGYICCSYLVFCKFLFVFIHSMYYWFHPSYKNYPSYFKNILCKSILTRLYKVTLFLNNNSFLVFLLLKIVFLYIYVALIFYYTNTVILIISRTLIIVTFYTFLYFFLAKSHYLFDNVSSDSIM